MTQDALVNKQLELEKLYSKNQLIPRIKEEFKASEIPFQKHMEEQGIDIEFGFNLLVQMALHKRATLPTLVGILRHHFDNSQATADALLKASEIGLVDWHEELRVFIVRFTISDELQLELDRFQFPLPMIIPPNRIKNNKTSGYLTGSNSVILQDNHHDEDVCLDHLNRVNQTRFTINQDVVRFIQNKWKNLDHAKPGEDLKIFEQRRKAFAKYDSTTKMVIQLVLEQSEVFHLTHRYDKRGRIYPMGYHINYAGNDWNKACVEFADKEHV